MIKILLKIINGKQFYKLTQEEKRILRNREYKKVLGSYIMISNTFMVFGLIVVILMLNKIMDVPLDSPVFYLSVGIVIFLVIASIVMFIQQESMKKGKFEKVKFDLLINLVILVFLTAMTIINIEEAKYLSLYAVGLITFALLVRVKPSIVLMYFTLIMVAMIIYLKASGADMYATSAFYVNIVALNIIIFFVARLLFVEHINSFMQQKKIREQNEELAKLATKDFLTGFFNRRGFSNRISEPIQCPAAICLFDLDGLKLINDAFGHEKGDNAIIFTANNIKEVFPESYCARLGGDEFVVLCENICEKEVAEKVIEFGKRMNKAQKTEINVSASLGYEMIRSQSEVMEAYKKAENIMYHLKLGARSSRKNRSMEALMTSLYNYTGESERHCHSVGYIAQRILSELGYMRKNELESIKIAGQLHDIGKLSIPQSILLKQERLTDEEWAILKGHSAESYKIACGLIDDTDIVEAILYHHERWDGNGYPYNLKGDAIPLFARIICVADSYDAMTSERCYGRKKSHEEACAELKAHKGTQFDPDVVDAFLRLPPQELKF